MGAPHAVVLDCGMPPTSPLARGLNDAGPDGNEVLKGNIKVRALSASVS
jgi:hypothetical protein